MPRKPDPSAPDPRDPSQPAREATGTTESETTEPASPELDPLLFGPKAREVNLRDVHLADLAGFLRAAVGLPPDRIGLGERAAGYRRFLPGMVPQVDVDAWIGWTLAGVPLFVAGLPKLRQARDATTHVLLVLALARTGGNLSAVGRMLGSSRKVLRENMQRLGLYPWPTTAPGGRAGVTPGMSKLVGRLQDARATLAGLQAFAATVGPRDQSALEDAAAVLTRWVQMLAKASRV